jgi:hypothetical protein
MATSNFRRRRDLALTLMKKRSRITLTSGGTEHFRFVRMARLGSSNCKLSAWIVDMWGILLLDLTRVKLLWPNSFVYGEAGDPSANEANLHVE